MKIKTKSTIGELIGSCREKDRKAQYQVYRMYYKAMYNTAFRIINNTAEAEDIMQESFLDAFMKIDQYEGSASFGAWLKRIVIHNAIDHSRKNQKDLSAEEIQDIPAEEPTGENPIEILSYKVDMIRKAIEGLSGRYRIILSLYLLEGYDHQEISQIMNRSYGATRTLYSRAKQRLLELLKERSPGVE
ncbi:MAG: RNA polymerase sigma factor [Bacteroidales bacterium]